MTDFGKKIYAFAINHNIPITNLQKMSGVCKNTWLRAINTSSPTYDSARQICDGLGIKGESRLDIMASAKSVGGKKKFITIRCADFSVTRLNAIKMIVSEIKRMDDDQLMAMAKRFITS